jgi:VanZ family protein
LFPSQSRTRLTVDTRLAIATLGVVIVIVYGSLYPFHFEDRVLPGGPLRALLATWRIPDGRGDTVSNVLLYIPLGLFAVRALRAFAGWTLVPLITLAGAALAMCMEMTQFYDPGRDPGMADAFANTAGTLVGALLAAWVNARAPNAELTAGDRVRWFGTEIVWRPFVILLIACWLGNRLFPYFPQIDFHLHWNNFARPGWLALYQQTVYWLAAAVLLESMFNVARSRIALAVMIAVVLAARLFLIEDTISSAEIFGALLGLVLWAALSRVATRAAIVSILFVALVILQALNPFHFLSAPREFGWMPFASFLAGTRDHGVQVFFVKAFTYGTLVWLPVRAGMSFRTVTILGTVLVFCLRVVQVYLPERSAEVTDAVMVVMLAGLMYLLREPRT